MRMLVIGMLLWSVVHLIPAAVPGLRRRLAGGLGENAYRAVVGLCIIAAVLLMVFGWKRTEPAVVYATPDWGGMVTLLAMLGMSISFFAPYIPSNLARWLRHPQLAGVVLFGVGHLVAVGHLRSLVLFGGMAAWALLEIVLINRRDGAWVKPEPVSRMGDFKLLLTGLGFFMIFMFTHQGLFGVSPLPD